MISTIRDNGRNICKILTGYRLFVRYKHQENHWSVQRKKKSAIQKAIEHFDDFYKEIYGKEWPSIRQGLFSKQKYVAVVNNYSDASEIKSQLENAGALNMRVMFELEKESILEQLKQNKRVKALNQIWEMDKRSESDHKASNNDAEKPKPENNIYNNQSLESSIQRANIDTSRLIDSDNAVTNATLFEYVPATVIKGMEDFVHESSHYKYYDHTDLDVSVEKEYDLAFPKTLDVYSFEKDNFAHFEPPKYGTTKVLNYYNMDGGSVLPILALDIRPGNTILDMCAAPGGKSLLALQTLCPEYLLANDITNSRLSRIRNVFKSYLYDFDQKWLKSERIRLSNQDARCLNEGTFDRIIVDVPCTNDRHSLKENDNNIFKGGRVKERLKLPELQSEILEQGLKLLKPAGILVYSTCSLSPIQNDGVVHMVLKKLHEQTEMRFAIVDLTPALLPARCLYKFAEKRILRYGHLVVPNLSLNFGPMYFCKMRRIS